MGPANDFDRALPSFAFAWWRTLFESFPQECKERYSQEQTYLVIGGPHFCGQQRYLTDAILDAITCQKGNTPRYMRGWKNYRLPYPKTFRCMKIRTIRKEVPNFKALNI